MALAQTAAPWTEREQMLLERIERLEKRLAAVEARSGETALSSAPAPPAAESIVSGDSPSLPGFLAGTTLNFNLDGYYGYNFNRPPSRTNPLRSNDTLSNNFTLNQADIVVERAPDPAAGRRLGMRLDLMFGQNTETLQGSALNEPRPQVYRHIFQAYGTYVVPLGSGLTVDFGKFSSALGIENNYVKDQINYSRSYYFNFLPFYHMGFRGTYKLSDRVTAQYWLVNGANQTEGFNNFKSNAFLFAISPSKNVSWNVNYFFGEQGRGSVRPKPDGREHIFDSYVNWTASPKLTLAAEGDFVVNRNFHNSAPARVAGGAVYAKYQFTNWFALGGRVEYLSDRGGLFSGATQALKEGTVTATFQPREGFQMRWEFRRDFSNQPFFATHAAGVLKREQDTALLGLLWWFGGKQGAW
jgi:hypothetical protein